MTTCRQSSPGTRPGSSRAAGFPSLPAQQPVSVLTSSGRSQTLAARLEGGPPAAGLNIIIPKFKPGEADQVWFERSLREGNFLHRYLARERARTPQRLVANAQRHRNYERRRGSEFGELAATMDLRTFLRWYQTDAGIIEDPGQFKKLVKDNPVMTPWKP